MTNYSRREFVMTAAAAAGTLALAGTGWRAATAAEKPAARRFPLGACDWSLGKAQTPEAFAVAKEIGLEGVEVSFGQPGGKYDLREESVRRQFLDAARQHGLEIASLAMGILNQIPYATDPRTEQWVVDVVEVMPKLGVKRCLLAFFGNGDIKGDRAKQAAVISRLKKVAPLAEKAGVVLGVESWMNADDHLRILDGVGSPAVQVYYDFCNMRDQGYDVCQEIRRLGKDRICQFHMKENGSLLGQGKVDFARVKDAIADIGYTGWLIIEGATIGGRTLVECYRQNRTYLRSLFPAA